YLASTAYLWLYATKPGYPASATESRRMVIRTGILGSAYSLWLLYAAGLEFVLMSTIVYAIGLPVFCYAQKENAAEKPVFTRVEVVAVGALVGIAVIAAVLFADGIVSVR